jgi:hypothetical protein
VGRICRSKLLIDVDHPADIQGPAGALMTDLRSSP